jgi:hypothetical protein
MIFAMNTAITSSGGALTPLSEVAKIVNLELWAVEKMAREAFEDQNSAAGKAFNPGDALTVSEVRTLARQFEKHGFAINAHSLRVHAKSKEEIPSRGLPIAPRDAWYLKENQ